MDAGIILMLAMKGGVFALLTYMTIQSRRAAAKVRAEAKARDRTDPR